MVFFVNTMIDDKRELLSYLGLRLMSWSVKKNWKLILSQNELVIIPSQNRLNEIHIGSSFHTRAEFYNCFNLFII